MRLPNKRLICYHIQTRTVTKTSKGFCATITLYGNIGQSGGDRTLDLLDHNQALLPTELLKELLRRSMIPHSPVS